MSNVFFLLTTTLIWGFGFIATKWTFQDFDGFWSHALRFLFAGFFSLPYLIYKKSFFKKETLKKSYIAAWFLFGALFFQTVGLYYTTVAKSGFITTMYALFTPMFSMFFLKKRFHNLYWLLVVVSFFGVALLCNLSIQGFNFGDFLTLICAICGAFHILYVEKIADSVEDVIEFNFLQSFFLGINSLIVALIFKEIPNFAPLFDWNNLLRPSSLLGLLYLSLLSSMVAFTLQILSQKRLPSHIVSLVFLLESPIAAFFGFIILNEKLTTMNLIGCLLILVSVGLLPIANKKRA